MNFKNNMMLGGSALLAVAAVAAVTATSGTSAPPTIDPAAEVSVLRAATADAPAVGRMAQLQSRTGGLDLEPRSAKGATVTVKDGSVDLVSDGRSLCVAASVDGEGGRYGCAGVPLDPSQPLLTLGQTKQGIYAVAVGADNVKSVTLVGVDGERGEAKLVDNVAVAWLRTDQPKVVETVLADGSTTKFKVPTGNGPGE